MEVLRSQISTREPWMLNTQGHFLYNLLSDQKLGADAVNSLVAFTLSVWLETTRDPPPDPYHKLVLFKSIFRTHLHGLYNEFHSSQAWSVFAYFVPQRDLCSLCCANGIELIITTISFHQIVLWLTIAKRLQKFELTPATVVLSWATFLPPTDHLSVGHGGSKGFCIHQWVRKWMISGHINYQILIKRQWKTK